MADSQTFHAVTIYSHQPFGIQGMGIMHPILGYSRIEAKWVTVDIEKSAQSVRGVSIRFVPRGKQSERNYRETSRATTVVLRGHGHPEVPHTVGTGPGPLFDDKWHKEFARFLEEYRQQPGVEVLLDLREYDSELLTPPAPLYTVNTASTDAFLDDDAMSVWEGHPTVREHRRRERNAAIVRAKREQVRLSTGKLECEVCGFDFSTIYGIDFCEVHHLRPLAESNGPVETKLDDLAVVCSNCHRVIHRRNPFFSISELRAVISERRNVSKAQ